VYSVLGGRTERVAWLDDRELVERAREDPEAFGALFDRYYPLILNYVARRTGDVTLAHDITSETFYRALKGIRMFRWRGIPFSAWLYRIASNEIASHFRRSRPQESLNRLAEEYGFDLASEEDLEAELIEAQEALARHERYQACLAALRDLPGAYQTVITLRFFEGKSIAEIAQVMGRPQGTVKSLLHRGLKLLGSAAEEFIGGKKCNLAQSGTLSVQED